MRMDVPSRYLMGPWRPGRYADELARRPCRLAVADLVGQAVGDLVLMKPRAHNVSRLADGFARETPDLDRPWKVDVPAVSIFESEDLISWLHDMRWRSFTEQVGARVAVGFDDLPGLQFRGTGWVETVWAQHDGRQGRADITYTFQLDGVGSWGRMEHWHDA